MSFTVATHKIITFDANRKPDTTNLGNMLIGGNLCKQLWFAFPYDDLNLYTVVLNSKRADGTLRYDICSKQTIDGVDYQVLELNSWYMLKQGTITMALKVYRSTDITIAEDGSYTLSSDDPFISVSELFSMYCNYAPNADALVEPFDPSDMQIILSAIGTRSSKDETFLVLSALPDVSGGEYDGYTLVIVDSVNKNYTVYDIASGVATYVNEAKFHSVHFDTVDNVAEADLDIGEMGYNDHDMMVRLNSSFVYHFGDRIKYVKASEALNKGDIVQFASATGGFVSVKKAVPSEINTLPHLVLGVAGQNFTLNGFGYILINGLLEGVNTSGGVDGTLVYLDTASASNGVWAYSQPTAPNAIVSIGAISNSNVSVGTIDIRITTHPISSQIVHNVTPTNYTPASKNVSENLKAIDTALGSIDGRVDTLEANANLNITDTYVVASESAMLALTCQKGDVAVRSDVGRTYILRVEPASSLANWTILPIPTDAVISVAGRTGAVVLTKTDVGLANVDNTSDANKPVSTAQQTALDLKANKLYATNLITNGNFANGLTDWNISGETSFSEQVVSGVFVVTVLTGFTTDDWYMTHNIQIIANHQYYCALDITPKIANTARIRLGGIIYPITDQLISGIKTRPSCIITATNTNGLIIDHRTTNYAVGDTVSIDNIVIIDITALYGAGKEHTVPEMNAKLSYFPNNYIDGLQGLIDVTTLDKTKADKAEIYGKTILWDGDSICHAADSYANVIPALYSMASTNYATDGGSIAYINGYYCISRNISSMSAIADYVVWDGGVNDRRYSGTLGAMTTGYADAWDDTTFIGALETMFSLAYEKWPLAKFGYIIIHHFFAQTDAFVTAWIPAIIAVCNKWGVHVIDLSKNMPPLNSITSIKNAYTLLGDGLHPNKAGYNAWYIPQIIAQMKLW